MSREYDTDVRSPWNAPIHQILRAIDNHNTEYFKTQNPWHLEKAQMLRDYVKELKEWIQTQEASQ